MFCLCVYVCVCFRGGWFGFTALLLNFGGLGAEYCVWFAVGLFVLIYGLALAVA